MATILLVEDEPALAQIITQTLEKNGHRVLHARDGQAALKLRQQHQPDLIILDWALFVLDGIESLVALRRLSPTPILMLTARHADFTSLTSLEFNADDTLAKPFRREDLLTSVQMLLHRAEQVQKIVGADRARKLQTITYQNLIVDAAQRRVTVDGRLVDLTPLEFDLLSLLLSSPGRVFSSVYLVETVCKEPYAAENLSLETAMARLRQKLGAAGKIETVFGAGYRLKPGR